MNEKVCHCRREPHFELEYARGEEEDRAPEKDDEAVKVFP